MPLAQIPPAQRSHVGLALGLVYHFFIGSGQCLLAAAIERVGATEPLYWLELICPHIESSRTLGRVRLPITAALLAFHPSFLALLQFPKLSSMNPILTTLSIAGVRSFQLDTG